MSTATQAWVRAELVGSPTAGFGAQLMIPADSMEFHDGEMVFQRQGEVVYVAEPGQLRSVTWLGKQPNPSLERRKAMWPNHGTRWTDEQRDELKRQLAEGESWTTISAEHGRSRTGVQQEAAKQGWVEPDTYQLRPEFITEYLSEISGERSSPDVELDRGA
jgi:hypothetical protein